MRIEAGEACAKAFVLNMWVQTTLPVPPGLLLKNPFFLPSGSHLGLQNQDFKGDAQKFAL